MKKAEKKETPVEDTPKDEAAQKDWFTHWVETTFDPMEQTLARSAEAGPCCHGAAPVWRKPQATGCRASSRRLQETFKDATRAPWTA